MRNIEIEDVLLATMWLVFIIVIIGLVYLGIQSNKDWEIFKKEHSCKIVAQIRGTTVTGVGIGVSPNGGAVVVPVIGREPNKTGWLCDDGVTYYR